MEIILDLIPSLGFPIVAVIALAWFVYKIYNDMKTEKQETINRIQTSSKEREDRLYNEIAKNREINGKFADIIAKYEVQFTEIKQDIKDIKKDVLVISEKIS